MADLKADDTGNAIVPVLACVLNQLCIRNDRLPISSKGVSKFHALRPPAITIKDYLLRVAKYAACSGECFVLALVYIDRIIQSNPTFVVNSLNIHRLLITSIMLAAKFFDDQYFNNAYYAKVGGVPCTEINSLEVEFLFLCNFALFVNTDTYTQYYTELCNHASNTQNACACSQGPRVPVLNIPLYHHIQHGAPSHQDLFVYFPVPLHQHAHLSAQMSQEDDSDESMSVQQAESNRSVPMHTHAHHGMQQMQQHMAQQYVHHIHSAHPLAHHQSMQMPQAQYYYPPAHDPSALGMPLQSVGPSGHHQQQYYTAPTLQHHQPMHALPHPHMQHAHHVGLQRATQNTQGANSNDAIINSPQVGVM